MRSPESAGPFSIAAFDVDGTLTDRSGAFDIDALELIRDLDRLGILVVVATARGPSGVAPIAETLDGSLWPKHQTKHDISNRAADGSRGLGTAASCYLGNDAHESTASGGLVRRKGGISRIQ